MDPNPIIAKYRSEILSGLALMDELADCRALGRPRPAAGTRSPAGGRPRHWSARPRQSPGPAQGRTGAPCSLNSTRYTWFESVPRLCQVN